MLTDSIHVYHPSTDDDDDDDPILSDSLDSVFRDETQCQHGQDGARILYASPRFGPLDLSLASPEGEKSRKLFAHYLWNAELYMVERVSTAPADDIWSVQGQRVLELGAGLGLGGIVSALAGADAMTMTDYPEPELLKNMQKNVDANLSRRNKCKTIVRGHTWGEIDSQWALENAGRFTRILVADCLWMPEQHQNLARSIAHFLSSASRSHALVVAGFHSGRDRMAPFFAVAVEEGLEVTEISEVDVEGNARMWQIDRGDENVFERKRWLAVAVLRRKP